MPSDPERRRASRWVIALPARLGPLRIVTRDISPCGVFLETNEDFDQGEVIQFSIDFGVPPDPPIDIEYSGCVVRREHGSTAGLGVTIGAFWLASVGEEAGDAGADENSENQAGSGSAEAAAPLRLINFVGAADDEEMS